MTNFVKIKTLNGDYYTIPVLITETIGQLKLKIDRVLGFSSNEQILNFNGRNFNLNGDSLSSCGIKYGDVINISFRLSKCNVVVCLLDNRKFDYEIALTDNVLSLKSKLQYVQELSINEQVLLYKGNALVDSKTFLNSGISDSCVISLIPKLKPEIQITIQSANNRTCKISFSERETVQNLKMKIQKQIGFDFDYHKLLYGDKYLEDHKTIAEYCISENSVIKVVEAPKNVKRRTIQICVKTMDGKTFDTDINNDDKIINVKKKLQETLKLKPDEQKMVFCGALLCDDKTVDEYGIYNKSVINVIARMRNGDIAVWAKTLDRKPIRVSISKNKKIIDLKKILQNQMKVDSEYLKLIYRGIVLENDEQVNECELCENSEIFVVKRTKNGINILAKTFRGQIIAFEVNKSDKISDVKEMLAKKLKLPLNNFILSYQGQFLKDDENVTGCGIVENSAIEILSQLR